MVYVLIIKIKMESIFFPKKYCNVHFTKFNETEVSKTYIIKVEGRFTVIVNIFFFLF